MVVEYIRNLAAWNPQVALLQNDYVVALAILLVFALLAKLLQYLFANVLQVLSKKTTTQVDDLIFEKTKSPFFYLILAYGLKLSFEYVGWQGVIFNVVENIMALVFVFIIARAIDVIIDVWGITIAKKTETELDEVLMPLFHKFSVVIFVIIAIMWTLNIWGVDITPYLAGAGIAGIVLGMALQDVFKNIFGGIAIMVDGTIKVGDKIKLESGEVGLIEDVTLRSTKIRTYDNEILNVPNGYMANSRIQNYTKPNTRVRVGVDFGVAYGSDVKKVQKTVLAALAKMDDVIEEPSPSVTFLSMGDFALNFKAFFWVENWQDAFSKKVEATELIYNALNKSKIEIPFPTQTLYVKK